MENKYTEIELQRALDRIIRLYRKIEGNCWLFIGALNNAGYGRTDLKDNSEYTHRLSAALYLNYNLYSDLLVLHRNICNSKACFNPEHLYIGTHQQNTQDIIKKETPFGMRAFSSTITNCPKGHEYTKENSYVCPKGKRYCRKCAKINSVIQMRRIKKLKLIRKNLV